MSLFSVSPATPSNVSYPSNLLKKAVIKQHHQPSVENTKDRLTPTQTLEADQLSGNHTQVQKMDAQADLTNPLTSQRFNSQVATSGV